MADLGSDYLEANAKTYTILTIPKRCLVEAAQVSEMCDRGDFIRNRSPQLQHFSREEKKETSKLC